MSSLLAKRQKYALASDGVRPQSLQKAKQQANDFACGVRFGPPFFEVKISRQARSRWKKFEGKKTGEVKSTA
jgi:hypothetical protein